MNGKELSRRRFLKVGGTGIAGTAIASRIALGDAFRPPPGTMPTRVLGKTGVRVGALALGSVGAPVDFPSDEHAVAFIRACIDAGITYFDTGPTYGHEGDSRSADAASSRRWPDDAKRSLSPRRRPTATPTQPCATSRPA